MADIYNFTGITTHKIPPEKLLEEALGHDLDTVVLLGYTKKGDEYFCCSTPDGGEVVWLLERAKFELMRMGDSEDVE